MKLKTYRCYRLNRVFRCALSGLLVLLPCSLPAQRGSQGYIPQINQGNQALKEGRWSSAISHYRAALIWSKGADAYLGLGNTYLKSGQSKRAEEEFVAALRLKPHSAAAERGIHQARSEDQEQNAFLALKEQSKQEPANPDLHATYAEELLERNMVDEARKEATLALKLDSKQGHAYCALGRIAVKENKDADAMSLLEQAIRLDNTDDDALLLLGDLAMRRKDYKQAISYYRRVVRIVPEESEGHKKLIEALDAAGDTRGAEKEKEVLARLKLGAP